MKHPEAKAAEISKRVKPARPLRRYCLVFLNRHDGTRDTLRTKNFLSGVEACTAAEDLIRERFANDSRDEYKSGTLLLKWKL